MTAGTIRQVLAGVAPDGFSNFASRRVILPAGNFGKLRERSHVRFLARVSSRGGLTGKLEIKLV